MVELPKRVRIVEVGPRDGLQNETRPISVAARVDLIDRLAAAGVPVVESGSFVSPKWVPQMASTDEVMATITRREGVSYPVLVPNMRGLEGALAANVEEIAVFAAASETFSQKNINCTIAESLQRFIPVIGAAQAAGMRVRGYVSCALGCPYEGYIAPGAVRNVAGKLLDMGCYEISLGDTVGVGTPVAAQTMVSAVTNAVPVEQLAAHFHDTYGQALANIFAVMQLGVATIDASISGLGGCPYAVGASGNIATEDVVYMLHGMGIETGIDLEALVDAGRFIDGVLGRETASSAARALRQRG